MTTPSTNLPSAAALALGLVAIVLIAAASYWALVLRFVQTTDDAYVGGDVTVLAPKVNGFVTDVLVQDNQSVKAGQVLIRLDVRDYRAPRAGRCRSRGRARRHRRTAGEGRAAERRHQSVAGGSAGVGGGTDAQRVGSFPLSRTRQGRWRCRTRSSNAPMPTTRRRRPPSIAAARRCSRHAVSLR